MARLRHDNAPSVSVRRIPRSGGGLRKERRYNKDGTIRTLRRTPPRTPTTDAREVTDTGLSHLTEDEESFHSVGTTPQPNEEFVVSIDLGTTNTIVAVLQSQWTEPGYNISLVRSYPDSPDFIYAMPAVPSRIQYDTHQKVVGWGYQVSDVSEEAVTWFKMLLTSDDSSRTRRVPEKGIATIGIDEETVLIGYLRGIFEATREHISADPATYKIAVVAALPSRSDQLALERYEMILETAALQAGLDVDTVTIHSEVLAAARNCLAVLKHPGLYFWRIHDGGGGTTNFSAMIARLFPDGSVQRETVHEPRYLSCGGEDLDAGFQTYVHKRYPDASPAQVAAFGRLWHDTLKVKPADNWTIDAHLKVALPSDFALDEITRHALRHDVFEPPIERIVRFLKEEDAIAENLFRDRVRQMEAEAGRSQRRQRSRVSLWDIEESVASSPSTENDQVPEDNPTYTLDELKTNCQWRFISSGGQSSDNNLQESLKREIKPSWERSQRARTNVVEGLLHLHRDAQRGLQRLPQAKHGYGFLGWNETKKNPAARFDRILGTYQRETPSLLIRIGADVSVGQSFRRPGREVSRVGGAPEWPEEIVIRQLTAADMDAWHRHKTLPRRAPKVLVLQFPDREVPPNLYARRSYNKDSLGPAIEMNVAEYEVVLKVERDGLLGQVISVVQQDVVITESRCTFREMGIGRTDL